MRKTTFARAALAGLTLLITAGLTTPSPAALTTNLIPNPSVEQSYLPPQIANPTPDVNQPVLPVGWIFEGASELFDHAAHAPGAHKGQYFVQVSGSWSGPRRDCSAKSANAAAPCVDVPGGAQRDQLYQYYSVAPAWRPQMPIPVTPGQKYTFSSWMFRSIPLDGTGAITKVRWLDANNVPIKIENGPSLVASESGRSNYYTFALQSAQGPGPFLDQSTVWQYRAADLTAPAGARFAIPLLGFSDSAWIGSSGFDYVCFTPTPALLSDNVCRQTFAQ